MSSHAPGEDGRLAADNPWHVAEPQPDERGDRRTHRRHDPPSARGNLPSWVDHRRIQRFDVDLSATVRESLWPRRAVRLADISAAGCRVVGLLLAPRGRVWIRIDGLAPLETEVRWCRDGEFGLTFHRPLHPAVVEQLTRPARGRA